MKLHVLGIFLALLFARGLHADEASAFPGLKTLEIGDAAYDAKIRVHFNPSLGVVVNKPMSEDSEFGEPQIHVLDFYLDASKTRKLELNFTNGASDDPTFEVRLAGAPAANPEQYGENMFGALEVFIPGNGALYASGHTNSTFNKRQKFGFDGSKLVESNQPYLYVGLNSKALRELAIFADQASADTAKGAPLAVIAKGAALTVLINDGDFYLLKSTFGLVGWVKLSPSQSAEDIDGLFFAGD